MADILVQHHGENKTAAMELQSLDSQAAPLLLPRITLSVFLLAQ